MMKAVCSVLALCSLAAASYRLPLEVVPSSYNIQLIPYLDEGSLARQFTFDGNVSILVRAARPESSVTLHAKNIQLQGLPTFTDVTSGLALGVTGVSQDLDRDFLVVQLAQPLTEGNSYRLNMVFTGQMPSSPSGFYRSSYTINGTTRWLAATQFEPTSARRAFPCFDEPALKATFKVSIARHPGMSALSNMPLESSTGPVPSLDGRYWDTFQTSVNMSTYLVAFVVSDFEVVQEGSYRVVAKPSSIQYGNFALDVGQAVIKVMENFTGVQYDLPKMDQVAVPDMSGAMENWGLVIYAEPMLLLEHDTVRERQYIASVIAHEFAHQWFGDLVTLNWWKFTWLNEGFASYFEYFATDKVFPEWRYTDQQVVDTQMSVLSSDSNNRLQPMTRDVETPNEISSTFNYVSYGKGGCVLKMLSHMITNTTFYKGLNIYLKARQYSNAVGDDLFAGLQQAVDEDGTLVPELTVKAVMDSWTLQAGYPVLTVTRDYSAGTASVRQAQYLQDPNAVPGDSKWFVPLSYTTSEELQFDNTQPRKWLTPANNATLQGLPGADQWLILNIQASGLYRINYDAHNWELLLAQLNGEDYAEIHPLNRAQLLDDSNSLAEAGLLDVNTALGVASYLERETDVIPWLAAFRGLQAAFRRLGGSPAFPALQSFYLRLLGRLYAAVGFEPRAGESHLAGLVRPQLLHWACLLGLDHCTRSAAGTLTRMRAAPGTLRVSAELRTTLYCAAVRHDGEPAWDFLWSLYRDTSDATERQQLLSALGCTSDTTLINRLLELSVAEDSGLKPQDRLSVFSAACNGRDSAPCEQALNFVASNIPRLARLFGEYESVATILHRLASQLRTRGQLALLLSVISQHSARLEPAEPTLSSAVSMAEQNVEWLETRGAAIGLWMSRHGHPWEAESAL